MPKPATKAFKCPAGNCQHCNASQREILRHVRDHHPEDRFSDSELAACGLAVAVHCRDCGGLFAGNAGLNRHKATCPGPNRKKASSCRHKANVCPSNRDAAASVRSVQVRRTRLNINKPDSFTPTPTKLDDSDNGNNTDDNSDSDYSPDAFRDEPQLARPQVLPTTSTHSIRQHNASTHAATPANNNNANCTLQDNPLFESSISDINSADQPATHPTDNKASIYFACQTVPKRARDAFSESTARHIRAVLSDSKGNSSKTPDVRSDFILLASKALGNKNSSKRRAAVTHGILKQLKSRNTVSATPLQGRAKHTADTQIRNRVRKYLQIANVSRASRSLEAKEVLQPTDTVLQKLEALHPPPSITPTAHSTDVPPIQTDPCTLRKILKRLFTQC